MAAARRTELPWYPRDATWRRLRNAVLGAGNGTAWLDKLPVKLRDDPVAVLVRQYHETGRTAALEGAARLLAGTAKRPWWVLEAGLNKKQRRDLGLGERTAPPWYPRGRDWYRLRDIVLESSIQGAAADANRRVPARLRDHPVAILVRQAAETGHGKYVQEAAVTLAGTADRTWLLLDKT